MKKIVLREQSEIATATVRNFHNRQAKLDAVIDYAAKVEDLGLLEDSCEKKVEDIRQFCGWWEKSITPLWGKHGVTDKVSELKPLDISLWKVRVSRWNKKPPEATKLVLAALKKAGIEPADNHRAKGTGESEWYTPAQYIESARKVLGEIDLDPATSELGQATVKAKAFFTAKDNGLIKEWRGRVWVNPPYSQPFIWEFVDKLINELEADRVTAAIMLTHNYSDTIWWHRAASIVSAISTPKGRIKFVDADGEECAPTQGQHFFYYGDQPERFKAEFLQYGPIWSLL